MSVTLIPVGLLRDHVGTSASLVVEEPGEITIEALLTKLSIPSELVAIALVNGQQRPKSHRLVPGDVVKLLPLMGGG